MTERTPRHALPLLAAGQAQKELFHNEALAILDMLVQPAVLSCGDNSPPSAPEPGQCWIVGTAPGGAWSGRADHVATWTGGGWRFAMPRDGASCWVADRQARAHYRNDAWTIGIEMADELRIAGLKVVGEQQAAIATPSGGVTIDSEVRAAVSLLLEALRSHGLIAS